ncbi:MAG: VOC family protein [Bacteroidota bacterium]
MATFNSLTPNLMVENVNETINFYHAVLGFEKVSTVPDEGEFVWASMRKDSVEIMFQEVGNLKNDIPELENESPGGGFTLFLKITGVTQLHEAIYEKADIVDGLRDTFYGMREFTVKDINGYYLTFAEPISS